MIIGRRKVSISPPPLTARLLRSAIRQALLGGAVTAATLPFLNHMARVHDLPAPAPESLILLAGSVVLAFAGGGIIGTLLAVWGRGRWLRPAAAIFGLVWGLSVSALALPLYLDTVMDDLTSAGMESGIPRAIGVLERPAGALEAVSDAANDLLQEGVTRLPGLALLGWALLGPTFAAVLEARPRRMFPPPTARE